jgi:hypothetical protein
MTQSEESRIAVLETKVDSILEQVKMMNANQLLLTKKMAEMDGARKLALWILSIAIAIGASAGWFAKDFLGKT